MLVVTPPHISPDTPKDIISNIMNLEFESERSKKKEMAAYKEAFDYFDWNKSGKISIKVSARLDMRNEKRGY